ncbi:MAG TPA: endonuclease/exonuclease/phosphatase family protein [Methylomirabilota bacterium]|jgi:endonuclease/exonuclease/phosphatase family metal-dependent hydrolase|nr:endonuclease/exonuclease/phosphatase family protein [Methylomirabilota bacterium]
MAESVRLRVATYNIHRGRGLDGRERLDRIAAVLGELKADVVALQEVFQDQAWSLAEAIGASVVFGPTRRLPNGLYGNVCLSTLPLVAHARYNLTCLPFEPRGCLRADIDVGEAAPLHVLNVHLGLGYRERIRQVRMLSHIFGHARLPGPRVLLGDFNEWFNGHASRLLRAEFGHARGRRRRLATHPSPMPVFPLDRIYHDSAIRVVRVGVHRSRLARVASDHLPTYADLSLGRPGEQANGGRA